MPDPNFATADDLSVPIRLMTSSGWKKHLGKAPPHVKTLTDREDFVAKSGQIALITDSDGALTEVFWGLGSGQNVGAMTLRALPARLPQGDYHLEDAELKIAPDQAAIAWALGAYRFDRYKSVKPSTPPRLDGGAATVRPAVAAQIQACALARDLINTPAADMGPAQLETAARTLANHHNGAISVISGDNLVTGGYPSVHAVGRAATAARAPRMIEMTWGDPAAPCIAIVGKGVTFDTGGLDIKPSSGMRWMKKDMGGAAHALALAQMVMISALPVRLVVLIPAVENAISADAMRPGDVLATRDGLSIEVGNTDAEGRLILADALTRAGELSPELTIDMATLTGAARVALGPDVVPFYTDDDALAGELAAAAVTQDDPLWRMPLWDGYESAIDSDIADIKNDADAWAQAGSITAALFLRRFAPKSGWVHLDLFAWNARARPGFPAGAEAQAIRALFHVLTQRYA